jgi:hypothetical protein
MISWFEMKEVLYVFLTLAGVALLIASYPSMHSVDLFVQIAGFIMLVSGAALVFFGLVTYFCRDDWEIWS